MLIPTIILLSHAASLASDTLKLGDRFPDICAETLAEKPVCLPKYCEGKIAVITLAFDIDSQRKIDTWANPLLAKYEADSSVMYFEVPMIKTIYRLARRWIDSGMREGIPKKLHNSILTYYGDFDPYLKRFGTRSKLDAYCFILDSEGRVQFFQEGFADAPSLLKAQEVIENLKTNIKP